MSLKPQAQWARRIDIAPHVRILTSDRTWEYDRTLPTDTVCPDAIAKMASSALEDILEQAAERGVALDWSSTNVRMLDRPGNTTLMVVQVDTL